jgi:hypothetical protein
MMDVSGHNGITHHRHTMSDNNAKQLFLLFQLRDSPKTIPIEKGNQANYHPKKHSC